MRNGDIQYIADSLLIEKLFLVDSTLQKQAGVMDLLSGVASSIQDWAKEHIDTSSMTGIISSFADLMVPGILFKISPLFGGLAIVANMLGFSPSIIVRKILSFIQPKLEKGESISLEDINAVGKDAVASEAGSMEAEASNDMFNILRKNGELTFFFKKGRGYLYKDNEQAPTIPFFGGSSSSPIERVFGNLFQTKKTGKAKWLLGGFIVWIIKTVLLGAGLVATGEGVKHLFQGNKPSGSSHTEEPSEKPQEQHHGTYLSYKTEHPESSSSNLTPTGYGTDIHTNDSRTSSWYVPIVGGTIESTLVAWAGYVYDELKGQSSAITSTPSFKRTVQEIRSNYDSGAVHLQVPSKFKSIKQVVDQFASDVAAKLKGI